RSDFQHQPALALLRQDDVLDVAAIQAAKLSRRPAPKLDENGNRGYEHNGARRKAGRNKRRQDAGWRHCLTILACTAAGAGTRVAAGPPASTAPECSGCGAHIYKRLSVRTPVCTTCGLIFDRDLHAARTSHWRGQRLRGLPAVAGGVNREPVGL